MVQFQYVFNNIVLFCETIEKLTSDSGTYMRDNSNSGRPAKKDHCCNIFHVFIFQKVMIFQGQHWKPCEVQNLNVVFVWLLHIIVVRARLVVIIERLYDFAPVWTLKPYEVQWYLLYFLLLWINMICVIDWMIGNTS